jgi:endonuclease G
LPSFISTEKSYHPKCIFNLERNGYTLAYDGRTKGAIWVYEKLTPADVNHEMVSRKGFQFVEDTDVPEKLRATNEDFRNSGCDRGHLSPALNAKRNQKAMEDAFLLTNASPQHPNLNRGLWRTLELAMHQLALAGKTVHIYTIPLFLPLEVNGERFVHYRVIGKHDVAVPTHFAKVAMVEGEEAPLAYLFPNEPLPTNATLDQFKTTLEKVERSTGVIFPVILH